MNASVHTDPRVAIVLDYFARVDGGDPNPFEHFLPDAQIYFPKFGSGRGPEAWAALGAGMASQLVRIAHHVAEFNVLLFGDTVVVEGTTEGELQDGSCWHGGQTSGGRFCSVFELAGEKIGRMHIYLDPDYAGHDKPRFLWGESRTW